LVGVLGAPLAPPVAFPAAGDGAIVLSLGGAGLGVVDVDLIVEEVDLPDGAGEDLFGVGGKE